MSVDIDFLVIGAQKCATSWLYYCLKEHPSVCLPSVKLEKVYVGGDLHKKYGNKWYKEHLNKNSNNKVTGDISVEYLLNHRSPKFLSKLANNIKLFASLRSPMDRAISAYFWNLRRGNVEEISINKGLKRAITTWEENSIEDVNGLNSYYYDIIERGMYARQIQRYVQHFSKQSIYLIYYDDIRKNAVDTLSRVFSVLGVNPDYRPPSLKRRPKQNSYLRLLLKLERVLPNSSLFGKVTDITNQLFCKLGLGDDRPSLSPGVKRRLQSIYSSCDVRLRDLTQKLPRSNILTPNRPIPPWTGG